MAEAISIPKDRSNDILRYDQSPLEAIFYPKTVALIGASEKPGSVGRTLLWNLISNPFGGTVFPVNYQKKSVLGIKAYPCLADVPEKVDLAIIATPAPSVPQAVAECAAAGVKGAIITSAGFREIGSSGRELEQQIRQNKGQMRVIGPNCLGVMNPLINLNATFAKAIALPGHVGLISQSGALCTSILDWSLSHNVGFSAFVSVYSMLDVDWGDLIYHFGDDPNTNSIMIYMEHIGDARSFLSAVREVALSKPIIVIKSGRTQEGAKAAASHTGNLVGDDQILDAAFRRTGVLRVDSIEDLFSMAELLDKQPRPKGKRLTIVTNGGGPGVIAADALIKGKGELAQLSETTIASLKQILPPHSLPSNPIDIQGDADSDRYSQSLQIAASDANTDGLLVILTPQHLTEPTETAAKVQEIAKTCKNKPLLASWMGGKQVAEGEQILNSANIYTCPYPDTAARLFNLMWQYSYNLRGLYETPILAAENHLNRDVAAQIINQVRESRRTLLTGVETKQLLAAYGIPVVTGAISTSAEDAVELANKIGYPVVLKLHSPTITHKSQVGGVQLNLANPEAVKKAFYKVQQKVSEADFWGVTVEPQAKRSGYELIIGSSVDPQFGPVLLFGLGGRLVEAFKDQALALPPLNTTLARRLMEQTHIYQALQSDHTRVDLGALEQLLVRFSQLVVEQVWLKEIEINPLLVSKSGIIALDARGVIYDKNTAKTELPRLAIRPYPIQYATPCTFKDGQQGMIRPIRPEDEPLIVKFHQNLSEESVYLRYFHLIKLQTRVSHDRLSRICFIDYDREMALVADCQNPDTGEQEIMGVARFSRIHENDTEAEFGMSVSDRHQGKGLGTQLLQHLLQVARQENLKYITAEILPENRGMQHLCQKLGFVLHRDIEVVKAKYKL